jgi:hypothetical protein
MAHVELWSVALPGRLLLDVCAMQAYEMLFRQPDIWSLLSIGF